MDEILCYGLLLCLMLLFQKVYKGRDGIRAMAGESWGSFICFPVFSIIVSVALSMLTLDGGREDGNIMLIVTAGFWLINLVAFDMMENILAGRAKAEKMRLSAERNRNQMEIYRSLMSTKNISGSIRSSSPGLMYPTVRRLYHFMITTIIC